MNSFFEVELANTQKYKKILQSYFAGFYIFMKKDNLTPKQATDANSTFSSTAKTVTPSEGINGEGLVRVL